MKRKNIKNRKWYESSKIGKKTAKDYRRLEKEAYDLLKLLKNKKERK